MLNFSKHFQIGIIRYHKLYRFCSSKTIFAVSSGQGKCAVSIIRISGKHTVNAMKLLNCYKTELPKPRTAVLRSIRHPVTNEILDKCLILWFPGPNSFTGEDSCELHVHGGIAVVNAVLTALSETPALSVAEPGDFTRRAFFNNKLDLTEVEGLADLLQAETEVQRKQAFLQTQGSLSKIYTKWKNDLLRSVAHIEAYIDFDETETIDVNIFNTCTKNIECLLQGIREHLKDGRKGEMLRNGVRTCIIGKPNVGKSSLMNLLCKRPAAIVTPIAGTTRDILEVTLNFDGYPLVLSDMAGLRKNTNDVIEQEGINKAIENCKTADLILVIIDSAEYMQWQLKNDTKDFNHYLTEYIESMNLNFLISSFKNGVLEFNKKSLIICNKVDKLETNVNHNGSNSNIFISCKNNSGIGHLVSAITDQLKTLCGNPSKEHPSMNQIRHRQHLTDCANSLQLFIEKSNNQNNTDLVLLVEYLRIAVKHLEKLLGKITTDEVLNIIFKDFCIGK